MASPFFTSSFSVSLLFFSFLLPSCLCLLSFGPFFCLFLSFSFFFAFVSWEEHHETIKFQSFFINPFSFLVSCLVFSFKSLFIVFAFSWFWFVLFVQHQCFCFQKRQTSKKTQIKKGGRLQQNGFFMNPFCKMWKVIVFGAPFCQILVDVNNTIKIGILTHFYRQKLKNTILRCYYLGQVGVIIWAKFAAT